MDAAEGEKVGHELSLPGTLESRIGNRFGWCWPLGAERSHITALRCCT